MDQKKKLFALLAALALVLGAAALLYGRLAPSFAPEQLTPPPQTEAPGNVESSPQDGSDNDGAESEKELSLAPDFTVYDAEGNAVKLSDFIGKPIVLNFWASWCGPCKMEMPDFDAKYQELGDEVVFMMVNSTDGRRETVETASSFIEEQGYTFPVFYDKGLEASTLYGASALPTTFFIDAQGHGIAYAVGAIDAGTLQSGLDMIYTAE